MCPYCQQPLTDKIKSDLQTAFDESYTEALNQLKELKNIFAVAYKQKFIEAANFLKSCDGFRFIKDAFTSLELQAQICLETIEKRLKEKEENPSAIIETPQLLDSILMNTMRRILEEYFLHNLGYTSGSLKKTTT